LPRSPKALCDSSGGANNICVGLHLPTLHTPFGAAQKLISLLFDGNYLVFAPLKGSSPEGMLDFVVFYGVFGEQASDVLAILVAGKQ